MHIRDVQVGDVIKTAGGKGIHVETKEPSPCAPHGIHINGRFCYTSDAYVELSRAGKDVNSTILEG